MRVKVWNDNPHTDWTEMFKGEKISIPSGKCIEMEFFEATEFKGQFSPIRIKGDETQDPKSFKMIRVEKINQEDGELDIRHDISQCNLCKKSFNSEAALLKHSEAQHADQMVVDNLAEASIPKRKPGRPKKGEEATT